MDDLPQNIIPPKGWKIDPETFENDWGDRDSPGQQMARMYGLNAPQPIMCGDSDYGEEFVMFQSGNTFYIWNQLDCAVYEIGFSQDLDKILQKMYKTDTRGLKLKAFPGFVRVPAGENTADGTAAVGNSARENDAGNNSEGRH